MYNSTADNTIVWKIYVPENNLRVTLNITKHNINIILEVKLLTHLLGVVWQRAMQDN
jgi:hypothetical protein